MAGRNEEESVAQQFPDTGDKAALQRRLNKIYGKDDDEKDKNAVAKKRGLSMSNAFKSVP